jgi:hypothetical protein
MANMSETNVDALIVSAGHTQAVKVRCTSMKCFLNVNPAVVRDGYVLWSRWKTSDKLNSDHSTSIVVSLAVLVSIPRHPSILLVLSRFEVYDYSLTLDREVDDFLLYQIDRHSYTVLWSTDQAGVEIQLGHWKDPVLAHALSNVH